MTKKRGRRSIFLLGALVGVLGGLILGSVATIELEDRVRKLARRMFQRLSDSRQRVRFELLGQ